MVNTCRGWLLCFLCLLILSWAFLKSNRHLNFFKDQIHQKLKFKMIKYSENLFIKCIFRENIPVLMKTNVSPAPPWWEKTIFGVILWGVENLFLHPITLWEIHIFEVKFYKKLINLIHCISQKVLLTKYHYIVSTHARTIYLDHKTLPHESAYTFSWGTSHCTMGLPNALVTSRPYDISEKCPHNYVVWLSFSAWYFCIVSVR